MWRTPSRKFISFIVFKMYYRALRRECFYRNMSDSEWTALWKRGYNK